MNDYDDELRRLLGDDRLALTPRADAVERVVKGAHRRRTARLVASAAGSLGVVAALAIGSMAVTGQFSAGPTVDPGPADSPTMLLPGPAISTEPTTPTTTPPSPSGDPTGGPSGGPAGEQPGPGGTDGSQAGDEPVDVSGLPLLDPGGLFDGVRVRMPLSELEDVPGVQITRLTGDSEFPELCYGEFRTERAHGYISVRGVVGSPPDDLMAAYEVATLVPDVAVRTPEGVGVGSRLADVRQTYPDYTELASGAYSVPIDGLAGVGSIWRIENADGAVSRIIHHGAHTCGPDPQPYEEPDLPVFDPAGLDGVQVGMTLAELEALGGVDIDTTQQGGACYGSFTRGEVSGWISHRREFPAGDSLDTSEWRVTVIRTDADVQTPDGIRAGSPKSDVLTAYPGLVEGDTFDSYTAVPGRPDLRWVFDFGDDYRVANFHLDGGQNCYG